MRLRLAMWSGPRNISTAMMRAWENRADSMVVDEPLYAHYLAQTGLDHPGRDEVIAAGETDWRRVVDALLGPVPDGRRVCVPEAHGAPPAPATSPRELDRVDCTNVLLIRDPGEVVASYLRSRATSSADDIGLPAAAASCTTSCWRRVTPP